MHAPVSHFTLIAVGVPNESLSIWLNKGTELSPAEPLKRAERTFNSSICLFIVLQNLCQPVTYLISSHAICAVNRSACRGTISDLVAGASHQRCSRAHCLTRNRSCKSCCLEARQRTGGNEESNEMSPSRTLNAAVCTACKSKEFG